MARLYISQDRLDVWAGENRVGIDGETMTLLEHGRTFRIAAAIRFLKVSGDDDDPHELVGKVKEVKELETIGADLMANSAIVGDTAYDVENGFLGTPLPK